MPDKKVREPGLLQSLIPIVILIALLALNVILFGDDTLSGANQIVLIFAATIAALFAISNGHKWMDLREGIVKSIGSAMPSILILLLIGSLAGTWLLSGVVPALIYYGLKIINPTRFLCAAVIVSALVSVATGSSWSTIATLGIVTLVILGEFASTEAGPPVGVLVYSSLEFPTS